MLWHPWRNLKKHNPVTWLRAKVRNKVNGLLNGIVSSSLSESRIRITKLEQRISEMEETQKKTLDGRDPEKYTFDIVIEKLHTDKVEFRLGSLSVKDLSGMLNIGMNYNGRLMRMSGRGETGQNATGLPIDVTRIGDLVKSQVEKGPRSSARWVNQKNFKEDAKNKGADSRNK